MTKDMEMEEELELCPVCHRPTAPCEIFVYGRCENCYNTPEQELEEN